MPISVIIPVYNRSIELKRAVDSVISQIEQVQELIIIDDGSDDYTVDVIAQLIQQYPIISAFQQSNQGVSAARNLGIKHANSDWIAFLDSDDEWLPNKIAVFKQHLKDHPECLLFHSDEIWIRNGVRVNAMKKHQKRGGQIFQHCLPLCVISPSASVLHRSLFEQVGLFNPDLPACEDYDLWLRICHQHAVCFSEQLLIKKYGGHADQLSAKHWGMDRFRIKALDDLLTQQTLNQQDQQSAIAMLCKKTKILLKGAIKHKNKDIIKQFTPLLERYNCGQ